MASIEEKHVVVISRELVAGAPIKIDITSEELAISMTLGDFLDALLKELQEPVSSDFVNSMATVVGNPAPVLTRAQLRVLLTAGAATASGLLRTRLAYGAVAVTDAMKRETARVM